MAASASALAFPATARRGDEHVLDSVRSVVRTQLAPLVEEIDAKGVYPEAVMRALGTAGAYATHSTASRARAPPTPTWRSRRRA